MAGRSPAHVIRVGNISATLWDNHKDGRTWYDTTIVRNYQDKGEWATSPNYRPSDLPVVVTVAQAALQWIMAQHNDSDGSS